MVRSEHLILYRKTYGLIKFLYGLVRNFPKEHKFCLGSDIIGLAWRCLDLIIEANAKTAGEKSETIKKLSSVFDRLKMRIRMSCEINLVSVAQFPHPEENYMLERG